MAIQKELWMSTLADGLFADNSFITKAFNADDFVSGKKVHIPNAGAASGVEKNRIILPGTVSTRKDTDVDFLLDEYTTNPVLIPNADTVELSYNKRESVIKNDKQELYDRVAKDFAYRWAAAAPANIVKTTGAVVKAHTTGAGGDRKAITTADVLELMVRFNESNVPQEGRYLLLDARMYAQLLNSLTANENTAFFASANAQKGILGNLFSFNTMTRSAVVTYNEAGEPKAPEAAGAATDCAGAIAWQEGYVCRALGEVNAFERTNDPLYYGDTYSFLLRAGGRIMRGDGKGVAAIVQDKSI